MAKTVRRRVSNSHSKSHSISEDSSIPQIQQFQDLIDQQRAEFETVKYDYTQQNSSLAKSNSSLLIKIRDMEKSVSDMVQENVMLRSKLSMNELRYKEKLNEHIQLMEKGVIQRFEEIFHIFGSIRRREGLEHAPQSHLKHSSFFNEPRSILKRSRPSSSGSRRASKPASITFNENENQVIPFNDQDSVCQVEQTAEEETISPRSRKRRRSSRRESLFIPADFEFSDDLIERGDLEPTELDRTTDTPSEPEEEPQEVQECITEPVQSCSGIEDSCNFTNSIIEYSIPEEMYEIPNGSKHSDLNANKLDVYQDKGNKPVEKRPQLLHNIAPSYELFKKNDETARPPFMQISTSSQKKVKHSMKSRGNKKKMVDEIMPTTSATSGGLLDDSRARRTRGKAVDYTLPSLRAKMRRPTEKLVDATTVTDIHDLQVGTNRRCLRMKSRENTPGVEDKSPSADECKGSLESIDPSHNEESQITDDNHTVNDSHIHLSSINRPLREKSPNKQSVHGNIKQIPLKDITNKTQPRPANKTKKLFKKPIIGDIGDENSCSFDDNSISRNSSFRVNEDDLSVFDLLDELKSNVAPKTHRAKAKQTTDKRGKKPTFKA